MDKPCIAMGCEAEGMFGLGSTLKGTVRWACRQHRALLEAAPVPVAAPQTDLFAHAR